MQEHLIKRNHDQSVVITTTGDTWHVLPTATSTAEQFSIYVGKDATHNRILNEGTLVAGDTTVYVSAADTRVLNGERGTIVGAYGVGLYGAGGHLTNRGTIVGEDRGVYVYGDHAVVHNAGRLLGENGIYNAAGIDNMFVNDAGGKIQTSFFAYHSAGATGTEATFVNHGTVLGQKNGTIIYGEAANDMIINDGLIRGGIYTGAGDDTIDLRGGTLRGEVSGSTGNDTLITDSASHLLREMANEGTDIVRSTVSYTLSDNVEELFLMGKANAAATGNAGGNFLGGNAGDNLIKGMDGNDVLAGRLGNDRLTGGDGFDTFQFSSHGGHDTVTDFVHLTDHFDISGWAEVQSFDDLVAHAHDGKNGVVIAYGDDHLIILGMHKADLDFHDFATVIHI